MQIAGGYLLIGVDDDGTVVGLPAGQARLFDEAALRGKLDVYLGPGYEIRSKVHTIEVDTDDGKVAKEVAIVWVASHPDGCNVFRATGNYAVSNKKQDTAFRAGDVYARHGSKSEPWIQADRAEANARRDAAAKNQWRAESADDFAQALRAATTASNVTNDPAATYTWTLDDDGLEAASVELLRRDDDVPVKRMLRAAQSEVRRLVAEPVGRVGTITNPTTDPASGSGLAAADDLATVLDRLVTLAALALDLDRPRYFTMVTEAFAELYGWAVEDLRVHSSAHGLVPLLWLRMAERLYALGGMAVRLKKWGAVRELALLDVDGLDLGYGSRTWHRDALTQSSRAGLFNVTRADGRTYEASLPSFARGVASRLLALRPDLPDLEVQVSGRDTVLLSVCSFDLLSALIASVDVDATTDRDVLDVSYPNFSRYDAAYDKVVTRILADPAMRVELLGQVSDLTLARVLNLVDVVGRKGSERFFGWSGFRDQAVNDFVAKHLP